MNEEKVRSTALEALVACLVNIFIMTLKAILNTAFLPNRNHLICSKNNRRTEMRKSLALLFTVLTIGLFNSCPTQGATLEQVKKEHVKKSLSTTEGQQIKKAVVKYSKQYKVDPVLIHAIILTESGYHRYAKSPCGATGLMQLMPVTFRARNVGTDIYAIDTNIHAGTKHYAGLLARYKGDVYMATAAYNLGGGALDSYGGRIPSHGKKYVDKVFYHKNHVLNDIQL